MPDIWERLATGGSDLTKIGEEDNFLIDTDRDGFTDFEEYRGFFIRGTHFRLNRAPNDVPAATKTPAFGGPLTKDAFVLDDEMVFSKYGRLLVQTKLAYHRLSSTEVKKPTETLSWRHNKHLFKFKPVQQSAVVNFNTNLLERVQSQFALRFFDVAKSARPRGGTSFVLKWNHPTPLAISVAFLKRTFRRHPAARLQAALEFLVAHEACHRLTLNHPARRIVISRILTKAEQRQKAGATVTLARGAFLNDLRGIRIRLAVEAFRRRRKLLEEPMKAVRKSGKVAVPFAFLVLDGKIEGSKVLLVRGTQVRRVPAGISTGEFEFRFAAPGGNFPKDPRTLLNLFNAGRLKLLVEVKHFVPSLLDALPSITNPSIQHNLQAKNLPRIRLTGHGRPDGLRGIDEELDEPGNRVGAVQ